MVVFNQDLFSISESHATQMDEDQQYVVGQSFHEMEALLPAQILSPPAGTCPRFRPKKGKVRSTLQKFCHLRLAPSRGRDVKQSEVRSILQNFCKIDLAPVRSSDPPTTFHIFSVNLHKLWKHRVDRVECTIHYPQLLEAPPGTLPVCFVPAKAPKNSASSL